MERIRKVWKNDLKTYQQVLAKLNEIIAEYNNYKIIGQEYNWQNKEVYKTTCENFEKDIDIFKKWANELI